MIPGSSVRVRPAPRLVRRELGLCSLVLGLTSVALFRDVELHVCPVKNFVTQFIEG